MISENSTTAEWILHSSAGGIGTIVLERGPANAYNPQLLGELGDAITTLSADKSVRVVIIKSAIPSFFCAGADIREFLAASGAQRSALAAQARAITRQIDLSPKVFIAAIAGHTLGGGLELALACDLRIASHGSYKVGLTEVRLGVLPGNGGTQRLARVVGASKALEMVVMGEPMTADEAGEAGLFNRQVEAANFAATVQMVASKIASGPPDVIASAKQSVLQGIDLDLAAGLQLEAELANALIDAPDATEGMLAYTEKRAPRFGPSDDAPQH